MLWLFHAVMAVVWIGLSVPALNAMFNGHWTAAAVWGGLALLAIGTEIGVARLLPRFLGRDPYADYEDR
jgi:hypothetical protein